jgi:hypothetical protein
MIMLPDWPHYAGRIRRAKPDKDKGDKPVNDLSPLPLCGYNKDTTKGERRQGRPNLILSVLGSGGRI